MTDDLTFPGLVALSLRRPEAAGRALIALAPSREVRLLGAAIVVILSALVTTALDMIVSPGLPEGPAAGTPLQIAVVQAVGIVVAAALMTWGGRMFGGQGRFGDALLLAIWTEVLLLGLSVLQLLLVLLSPLAVTLVAAASFFLVFWLSVGFVCALHGFTNRFLVFLGTLATLFIAGAAFLALGTALGIIPAP